MDAQPQAANNEQNNSVPQSSVDPVFDICAGIDEKQPNFETFIKNIWNYILNYSCETGGTAMYKKEVISNLLKTAKGVLSQEPTVLDLQTPLCILGPLHGQGDSLVTLLSLAGKPPEKTFLFLGNYSGMGFAPHETLFIILAFKVRFPKNVYLLKGYHEDADVLKSLDFVSGLIKRGLVPMDTPVQPDALQIWNEVTEVLAKLPLAAVLNGRILCMQGGPGPTLRQHGLSRLRTVERPPINDVDVKLTVETMWSCLLLTPRKNFDGMPTFSEKNVTEFCSANKIGLIIRGRQLVEDGFLNLPKEMLTVTSAAAFLDNFRNCGAVVMLKKDPSKINVVRYRVLDAEPASLDDNKPTNGRNSIPMP